MADEYNTELDGTRELLQGLSIGQETSHNSHTGQLVYRNQVTAFLH